MNKKKTNILLVDDEESHAELISKSFESVSGSVSVTVAYNLHEARTSIAKSTPDLIIADFLLPDGKGIELIPARKEKSPYPVIILTSHGDEQVAVEAMKAGAFDYIVKSEAVLDDMHRICERIMREWNNTIERKQVEEALSKSEEKYRNLVETAQDAIMCDINGIISEWNKSAERVFGYSKDEIIGKPVNILVPDKYKKEHREGFERFLKTGEARIIGKTVEVLGLTKEGVKIPIEMSLTYQKLEQEQHLFTAIIRDITERKQAEKKLKENEYSLNEAQHIAKIGSWDYNLENKQIKWSDEQYRIFGYEPNEIEPTFKKLIDAIHPDDREAFLEKNSRCIDEGAAYSNEYRIIRPDGSERIIHSQAKLIREDSGNFTRMPGTVQDITERKKMEENLKRTTSQLSLMLESLPIIPYTCKAEGDFGATYVGTEVEKVTGFKPEVFTSNDTFWADRIHPDDAPRVFADIPTLFEKGYCEHEYRWQVADDSYKWFYDVLRLVKLPDKKTNQIVGIWLDITERKKMEEALLQSEKLKSIGTITAGVAHEFNNILAIISGNAQLLEETSKDNEELTNALRTIRRATNDGAEISKRMLKFTKTAKDTAGFAPFDINELINQAIDFTMPRWKNMAQAKGINYNMDTEGMKRVPSILCNPVELREVLVNIINNALDAMPDDGRITFRTWSKEDTVFISISDTGEGMSEEVKKNIFDPFFTTKLAEGTGLGMSTAYGIVTGHGGKIEVESEVGNGTILNMQFPIATKADSPKELPELEQEIKTNSLRILVVDDEEEICKILDKFLSKKGHLVRIVDNGREAIMLTKIDDYDLVLCDMAMPEVFGYDVIRALNKLEKRPKIGIITGWGEKLKSIDDEGLKVDFIIKKPFDLSELTKHINDVIDVGL